MKLLTILLFSLLVLTACNEERGVISELKECDSSKSSDCQNTGNLENDFIIRVEGEDDSASSTNATANSTNKPKACSDKYIQIDNFCIMRDEAVQANRYKIRTKSIESAEKFCSKEGKNIHLINHDQWMAVARKIEAQPLNYDLGKKKKFLNSRELFVNKDQTIVNFVSGQMEWVAWSSESLFLPFQCSVLEGKAADSKCLGSIFGSKNLDGDVHTTKPSLGSKVAMTRSGSLAKHGKALYHTYIGSNPAVNEYGVRCAYSL